MAAIALQPSHDLQFEFLSDSSAYRIANVGLRLERTGTAAKNHAASA